MFLFADTVDTAPTYEPEPEPEEKPQETRPTEIRDSSGRPLFGGLRALKATSTAVTNETSSSTTTTTSKSSIVLNTTPRVRDRTPSVDEDKDMPEQPVTSHLRELVTKHEQQSREYHIYLVLEKFVILLMLDSHHTGKKYRYNENINKNYYYDL